MFSQEIDCFISEQTDPLAVSCINLVAILQPGGWTAQYVQAGGNRNGAMSPSKATVPVKIDARTGCFPIEIPFSVMIFTQIVSQSNQIE